MDTNQATQPKTEQEGQDILDIQPEIKPSPAPKKRRRKNSWWGVTLCVFLAIGVFISAAVGTGFLLLRNAVAGDIVHTVVEQTDVLSLEIDGSTVAEKVEEVLKSSGNETLASMSAEDIRAFAENAGLDDALKDLLDRAQDYLAGNAENFEITPEQIMVLVEDNKQNIYDATGYEITDKDLEQIESALSEHTETINKATAEILADPVVKTTITSVNVVISPYISVGAFAVTAVCILLMIPLLRRKEGVFIFSGIPALLWGVILAVVYGLSATITEFVISKIPLSATMLTLARTVLNVVFEPVLTAGIIAGSIGLVFIVLYIVLAIVMKKSKKYAN